MYEQIYKQTDRWTNMKMAGCTNIHTDLMTPFAWIDGRQTDGWTDKYTDIWTDVDMWTGRWTDGQLIWQTSQ